MTPGAYKRHKARKYHKRKAANYIYILRLPSVLGDLFLQMDYGFCY